jgi:hypothetical protein
MREPLWQKSTFSEDQANCLNIAPAPDGTLRLRESDTPGVTLATTPERLVGLLDHIKIKAARPDPRR